MSRDDETIILSLGGSLIVPNGGINTQFLIEFDKFVRRKVAEGRRFFIVCGGGSTARHYRDAGAGVVGKITNEDLDWLGIHTTRLNAHLLRTIFMDIAHPRIIENYNRPITDEEKYSVIIAAGWKPGWSTDYCAALLAKMYHAQTIINMSNISMVYTKDPRKYKDARPIEKTSWDYFRSLVGDRWDPGMNVPFDPIASKLASDLGITAVILKGDDLFNLENVFEGKKFKGTVISPFKPDAAFFDREYFEGGILYKKHGYTTSFLGRAKSTLANLYRALKIKIFLNPKSLLDVGCATGKMVFFLRKLGVDAHGIEFSEYALSKVSPKVKPFLKKGNILDIFYKDNSFDTVTSVNVLEHIEKDKILKAVDECNRVARKYVVHKIYTEENWWIHKTRGHDLSCVSVFPILWWKNFFKENGFKEKAFYPTLPLFMETIFVLEKKR